MTVTEGWRREEQSPRQRAKGCPGTTETPALGGCGQGRPRTHPAHAWVPPPPPTPPAPPARLSVPALCLGRGVCTSGLFSSCKFFVRLP